MALGNCRHCGVMGIPADAPLCRACGGWRPNPGFFTRMGVVMRRLLALIFLVPLIALGAWITAFTLSGPDRLGVLWFLLPVMSGVFACASSLVHSMIWPYGRDVCD